MRVALVPGTGMVARAGGHVLLAPDGFVDPTTAAVLEAVRGHVGSDARTLVREVVRLLSQSTEPSLPALGLVSPVGDEGWAVLLCGPVRAHARAGNGATLELSGLRSATWLDQVVPGPVAELALRIEGAEEVPPAAGSDLVAGVVPGGGVVLVSQGEPSVPAQAGPEAAVRPATQPSPEPAGQAAPQATAPEPVDVAPEPAPQQQAPAAAQPAEDTPVPPSMAAEGGGAPHEEPSPGVSGGTADLVGGESRPGGAAASEGAAATQPSAEATAGPAPRPDAPVVDGVVCVHGHFVHPLALTCPYDGESLVAASRLPARQPRPPLGELMTDDGRSVLLDHDYVVGREAATSPLVAEGRAEALVIDDAERSVSRIHARVVLDGWDVTVVDAGSANGTYVRAPTDTSWTRLQAEVPFALVPGSQIAFGKRIATFRGPGPHLLER